jgi:thioredoxin reductase
MKNFDVIIVGGSYAGLSAGMALGRSLRKVLIIDAGKPCNAQTPHSHNFLTRDGETPATLRAIAKDQVLAYDTVEFMEEEVVQVSGGERGFEVVTGSESFMTRKLIFSAGVKDIMPDIRGFAACWGISVLHCPYCHGYEIRNTETGVMANGDMGFEFVRFIHHWTSTVTLLTNGPSLLSAVQTNALRAMGIKIVETEIAAIHHSDGYLDSVTLQDDRVLNFKAIYAPLPFTQGSDIPEQLGCEINEAGFIVVDQFQKTNVPGIYAAGDCTTRMRSVASAVAEGNKAGAMINREMIQERLDA